MKYLIARRGDYEHAKFLVERDALARDSVRSRTFKPNLLYFESFDELQSDVLVTSWVDGEPLGALLDRATNLSVDERLACFHRIVASVSFATLEYQHRDLHPGNIIMLAEDTVRMGPRIEEADMAPGVMLLDWGEALPVMVGSHEDEPEHHFVLRSNASRKVGGSFVSLPPEVFLPWKNEYGIGGAYEAWACGLLMHRLLTGKQPIQHGSLGEYLQSLNDGSLAKWMEEASSTVRDLFPDNVLVSAVLEGLLQLDPRARLSPSTAGRMLWDIRYEGLAFKTAAEARPYVANPHAYTPESGWRFSSDFAYD
jgi:serine/threonine protein kinase